MLTIQDRIALLKALIQLEKLFDDRPIMPLPTELEDGIREFCGSVLEALDDR
ncbi:MAG: hypothetical protein AAGE03_04490 [Pseudomonadota bacterium]